MTDTMNVRKNITLNTPPSKRIADVLRAGFKQATAAAAQMPAVNTMTTRARISTPRYKQTIPKQRQSTASKDAPHPATVASEMGLDVDLAGSCRAAVAEAVF